MSVSINLANKGVENKKKNVYMRYATWFFVVCVLLSVSILSYSFFLRLQVADMQNQEEALRSEIGQYEAKIVDHSYLNQRLSRVRTILNDRSPLNSRLSVFLSQVPQNVEVARIDGSSKVMNFRLVSTDLAAMQNFIEDGLLQFSEQNDNVQTVYITSFGIDTRDSQYYTNTSVEYIQ